MKRSLLSLALVVAGAAAALNDYLVHSERIVLAVYARRISDGGQPK